ncbi:MAG TPA: ATP-binding protein [Nitrososphaera sp.]|jgi:signal transduction histidine kinase|nr:ATP-binding protein [Nitrososphaera sp.]
MKIVSKIVASFLITFMVLGGATAFYLLSPEVGEVQIPLFQKVIIIFTLAMGVLGILLSVIILHPLKKLAKGAEQITEGNFAFQIYDSALTKGKFKSTDELSQLIMAFEVMRKRTVELDNNLGQRIRTKTFDLQRVNDELIEKEKILQQANAKLVNQSEDLRKINKELAERNKELSEANTKLRKLDAMKTDFIMIAAHELRTPIQLILGSVQLAEKGLINSEQAWKTIASEVKKLAEMATYLLDVGKIESGTFTYDMKPLDVSQLVEELVSSSTKFCSQDDLITINIDLDDDHVKILADEHRLMQAFLNIINNAVKFAKNGTITIRTRTDRDNGLVEVKVVDDGTGIPEEILPILFSKFVTKTNENERGTGLGLFITKSIVEAHKASIKAMNNKNGKGATFTVSFPIYERVNPVTVIE